MFERFTDRARRVIVLAQEEARRLNHNYIGTEHVLLGLSSEGEGIACRALEGMGVSLDALRAQVEEIIGSGDKEVSQGHIPFTPRAKKVLELSFREAQQLGHNYIGTEHILLGIVREGQGVGAQVLARLGVSLAKVRQYVVSILSGIDVDRLEGIDAVIRERREPPPRTGRVQNNLTLLAHEGKLAPLVGRGEALDRLFQGLSRRTGAGVALIGAPGVGKTALVDGLAQAIDSGESEPLFLHTPVFRIGAPEASALEPGWLKTWVADREDAVLFLDDVDRWSPVEDLLHVLRTLAGDDARVIAAMGLEFYRNHLAGDPVLARAFQPFRLTATEVPETVEILKTLRESYEGHYRVTITDAALEAAAAAHGRYLPAVSQPGKAIHLLDEAASRTLRRGTAAPAEGDAREELGADLVRKVVEERVWTDSGEKLPPSSQAARPTDAA